MDISYLDKNPTRRRIKALIANQRTVDIREGCYYSTIHIKARVDPMNGNGVTSEEFALIFDPTSDHPTFFSTGFGGCCTMDDAVGGTLQPRKHYTNLMKPYETIAGEYMSVEGIALVPRKLIPDFASAQNATDPTVQAAMRGEPINGQFPILHDPENTLLGGALCQSKDMFHHAVWSALREAGYVSYCRGAGTDGVIPLGATKFFGDGGAEPLTNTFGQGPASWFPIGQGILWAPPESQAAAKDKNFGLKMEVLAPVVVKAKRAAAFVGDETLVAPTQAILPLTAVVFGCLVRVGESANSA